VSITCNDTSIVHCYSTIHWWKSSTLQALLYCGNCIVTATIQLWPNDLLAAVSCVWPWHTKWMHPITIYKLQLRWPNLVETTICCSCSAWTFMCNATLLALCKQLKLEAWYSPTNMKPLPYTVFNKLQSRDIWCCMQSFP